MQELKITPLISVLMSIYNEPEEWLRESIESILNQTYTNFEFIIINDNPKRNLNNEILSEYKEKDPRIVVIKNSENIGLTKSLNKGLKIAKGEFIARMDADDISDKIRLEKQLKFMISNSSTVLIGSYMIAFGEDSHLRVRPPVDNIRIKLDLVFYNSIPHPTAFLRRNILEKHQLFYNENLQYSQDIELWHRLTKFGEFYNIPEYLVRYRNSNTQISTSKKSIQNTIALNSRIKYLHSNFRDLENTPAFKKYEILGEAIVRHDFTLAKRIKSFFLCIYFRKLGLALEVLNK